MLKIKMETIDFCMTRGEGRVSSKMDKWWGQNEYIYIYTIFLVVLSLYLAQKILLKNSYFKVDKGKCG